MATLRLPNSWQPRGYQLPLWKYLEDGGKRAVAVWHRRAGKDDVALNWTAVASQERVGNYWHLLPQASQARKAVWDAINPHTGKKRVDEAFPIGMRDVTRENEMAIKFRNGSMWQLVGSDNYDSLVGSPPVGVVFSEWALADPAAWSYIRPILAENKGWAMFIYTPRGRNHGATFYEGYLNDPEWFCQKLTARDTDVFHPEALTKELKEYEREYGIDDGGRRFNQEYLCDFEAAIVGAYYGREMASAEADKRIKKIEWERLVPVHTAWDLGIGDSTVIWFFQVVGKEKRLIDYIENNGVGLDWYVKQLRDKPYIYGDHFLPHDASVKELGTGKSRVETLQSLGLRTRVLRRQRVEDGINAVRAILPHCWFDAEKCAKGIDALRNYRREWDDKLKNFKDRPLHDWSSHAADAFRYLAEADPSNDDSWARPIKYPRLRVV